MKKTLALIGFVLAITTLCSCKSEEERQMEVVGKKLSGEMASKPSPMYEELQRNFIEDLKKQKEGNGK